ncbi:MAG: hypothetical protein JW759_02165 [Candidatus Coatesbacteria bacterium]|nr:hypothetical protein [Candidatus Coatesbacteria bacterium]
MNRKVPLELALRISFASAASLPSLRRPGGGMLPYISGSMIKGAIRAAAERILDLNGIDHCSGRQRRDSCESKPCLICSLFGRRPSPGKVIFEGGAVLQSLKAEAVELPRRSRARDETVRTFAPQTFAARLVALNPLTVDEEQLLLSAVRSVKILGGGKTQGLGFCSVEAERKECSATEALPKSEALEGEGNEVGLILVAEGPICVARSPIEHWYRESLDYVPGVAIRSAFHDQLGRLEQSGVLGTEMKDALLAPSVLFSDCLPFGHSVSAASQQSEGQSLELPFVLPFSAACYGTGFRKRSDMGSEPPDMLIRHFVLRECYRNGLPYVLRSGCPQSASSQMPRSGSDMVWRGQLVSVSSDVASYCPVERVTKRSIPQDRHCVSFIQPGTLFAGTIRRLRPAAKDALRRLATEKLSVGALRSRGLGRLSFRIVHPPAKADVGEAIRRFNGAIAGQFERWGTVWDGAMAIVQNIEKEGRLFFSMGLLSDLMLPKWSCWDGGEATPLEKLLSEAGIVAQEVLPRLQYGTRGGWNAACQAPRGLAPIIRRGSVSLFETRVSGAERQELCAKLESVQDTGLGLRTCDGFGEVVVCSSFHTMGYLES